MCKRISFLKRVMQHTIGMKHNVMFGAHPRCMKTRKKGCNDWVDPIPTQTIALNVR